MKWFHQVLLNWGNKFCIFIFHRSLVAKKCLTRRSVCMWSTAQSHAQENQPFATFAFFKCKRLQTLQSLLILWVLNWYNFRNIAQMIFELTLFSSVGVSALSWFPWSRRAFYLLRRARLQSEGTRRHSRVINVSHEPVTKFSHWIWLGIHSVELITLLLGSCWAETCILCSSGTIFCTSFVFTLLQS
jgi:hypothetical protein